MKKTKIKVASSLIRPQKYIEILQIKDQFNARDSLMSDRSNSFNSRNSFLSARKDSLNKSHETIHRKLVQKKPAELSNRIEKKDLEISSRLISSLTKSTVRRKSLKSLARRSNFMLDPTNPKLQKIFQNILTGNHLITGYDFEVYLKKRYPGVMAEVMAKYFDFHSVNYENYVAKMKKFINLSEKELLKFCFSLFDINKDGFICYKDAFAALLLRKENLYDEDFIVLRELLQLKFEGKLDVKKMKRKSTFGMIIEKIQKKMVGKIVVPIVKQNSKTQINFSEFKLAKFNNRPQILKDFFKYTCGFNYIKNAVPNTKVSKHAIKDSESIVIEMNISKNFHEEIMKNEKYHYYCELDEIMSKYSDKDLRLLLKKFKVLQSTEKFFYKIISKESMIEKFVMHKQPIFILHKNEQISMRMFELLSNNRYLTKARFLSSVHDFYCNQSSVNINKLAFSIFDTRKDGKITVDEISDLFSSLLYGSEAYSECLK